MKVINDNNNDNDENDDNNDEDIPNKKTYRTSNLRNTFKVVVNWDEIRGKKLWKVNHNHLTPKSDQHLISPYNITLESNIKVVRIIGMITNYISSWLLTNDTLTSRSITIILQKTTHLTWKENLEPKLFTFTSWINTSNWNVKIHILLKNNFLRQKGYIYAQSTNTPSDFLSLAWPVITLYQK